MVGMGAVIKYPIALASFLTVIYNTSDASLGISLNGCGHTKSEQSGDFGGG